MQLKDKFEDNVKKGIATDNDLISRMFTILDGAEEDFAKTIVGKTVELSALDREVRRRDLAISNLKKQVHATEAKFKKLEETIKYTQPRTGFGYDGAADSLSPESPSSVTDFPDNPKDRTYHLRRRLRRTNRSIIEVSVQQKILLAQNALRAGDFAATTEWATQAFTQARNHLEKKTMFIGKTQFWIAMGAYGQGNFAGAWPTFRDARENGIVAGCGYEEGDFVDDWISWSKGKAEDGNPSGRY